MKKLIISEMMLLSFVEKRAKRIPFHPKTTLIKGVNDTGKSSLIKSILFTFGAEPSIMHPRWKSAEVLSVVKFKIATESYSLMRNGDYFALFDSKNNLIRTFNKITSELGPFFAELLDFKITLNDRNGNPSLLPPAYYFLPFYIDQDKGWADSWASFNKLGQFKNWKKDLIEYHIGIKPNEYYECKSDIGILQEEIKQENAEKKVIQTVVKKVDEKTSTTDFDFDFESFKSTIDSLIFECKILQDLEQKLKSSLTLLNDERLFILSQIKITEKIAQDLKKDYQHACEHISDEVSCPTCGAVYENSFKERFNLASDEDECNELLLKLSQELIKIDEKILKERLKYNNNLSDLDRINALLETKNNELKLKDIIQNEGKKEVKSILYKDIDNLNQSVDKKNDDIIKKKKTMNSYLSKDHKNTIINNYHTLMKKYLFKLNVENLTLDSYRNVEFSIKEMGSDLPRALLAYYYSILNLIYSHSSTVIPPMIIDSPNQQDQEDESLKMLEFIKSNTNDNSQLILGLVNDCGIDFDGLEINLNDKNHLLQEDEYDNVYTEIKILLSKCFKN
ncbi:hypothetical protein [Clostridium intestinale]|uniref:Uncharacterized protein n=1 Tax=Clostridium intestinale TaxID=36845 RepID=A0A7D7A6C8_9CLOT|nr:hypothetical protein [Clostridium intestinale]QLY81900.1 hypothetical protein HZF06_10035 [Clostridium intestinale]